MARQFPKYVRVEVKARITEDLHRRMLAELGECGCSINGFVNIAIAREVAYRRAKRGLARFDAPLPGQQKLEGLDRA